MVRSLLAFSATVLVLPGGLALAQEYTPDKDQVVEQPNPYSPYVDQHFPQRALWGDTHFYSSLSVDNGLIGTRSIWKPLSVSQGVKRSVPTAASERN